MSCLRTIAVLLALPVLLPTVGGAKAVPVCVDRGPGTRVCSELDEGALSRSGDSTTWRVWVEGKNPPLQVRLHNSAPERFRVRGGDDQVIHLGCRRHREVRRKVVALAPAAGVAGSPALAVTGPQLDVRPYSAVSSQEAAAIAAALVPRLAQIEAEFIRRRGELPAEPSAAAVEALLEHTESELLTALSYGELAPLRDYVVAQFRRPGAGREGTRQGTTKVSPHALRRPVLVSLVLMMDRAPSSGSGGDSMLDQALRCIRRLRRMAESNDLTTSLCLTSEPTRATFRMRPESLNRWLTDKVTTGEYRTVFRGLYVYSARKGLKTIQCLDPERAGCAAIDLVDDTEPTFQCDFESGVCQRRSEPSTPEGCHAGNG